MLNLDFGTDWGNAAAYSFKNTKQHKDGDLQNDDIKCAKEKGTTIYNYNIKNK